MSARKPPVVGEKLLLRRYGMKDPDGQMASATVSWIGRKWFKVKMDAVEGFEERFSIEDWEHDPSCDLVGNYALSRSRDEFREELAAQDQEREHRAFADALSQRVGGFRQFEKLSLEQLKRIAAIVDEPRP